MSEVVGGSHRLSFVEAKLLKLIINKAASWIQKCGRSPRIIGISLYKLYSLLSLSCFLLPFAFF